MRGIKASLIVLAESGPHFADTTDKMDDSAITEFTKGLISRAVDI